MQPVYIYLLKTVVCSGILFLYYRLALYDRLFHEWNRFYLAASVLLSIFIPLLHIELSAQAPAPTREVIGLLNIVSAEAIHVDEQETAASGGIGMQEVLSVVYVSVSCIMLLLLFRSLFRLYKLYYKHPKERIEDTTIIMTQEKDAPFSFFRNIFWNTHVDMHADTGRRILQHEIAHVRQLHSADRLLMNMALIFFWFNPFFWLIRREMCMVHEFIADSRAMRDHDFSHFSEMVLLTVYPGYRFNTTSYFSSLIIKRRLLMLTKLKTPTANYAGRLFLLPVLILVFAAFAMKTKKANYSAIPLDKTITVIIDAGHGGNVSGATAPDGAREKDLNLALAKRIMELNRNNKIRLVATRQTDIDYPLKDRVGLAIKEKADLFISLHVNNAPSSYSGIDCVVSDKDSKYLGLSQLFGSLVSDQISKVYSVSNELKRGSNTGGIWVLDAPEITYPALLIECGNLNNDKDLAFIKDGANQDKLAGQILKAIELYAKNATGAVKLTNLLSDTVPVKMKSMSLDRNRDRASISFSNNQSLSLRQSSRVSARASSIAIENPEKLKDSTLIMFDDEVHPDLSDVNMDAAKSMSMFDVVDGGRYKKLLLLYSK